MIFEWDAMKVDWKKLKISLVQYLTYLHTYILTLIPLIMYTVYDCIPLPTVYHIEQNLSAAKNVVFITRIKYSNDNGNGSEDWNGELNTAKWNNGFGRDFVKLEFTAICL